MAAKQTIIKTKTVKRAVRSVAGLMTNKTGKPKHTRKVRRVHKKTV